MKIKLKKLDFIFILFILFVLISSILMKDNICATISSVFGIIYTILLGKRKHLGYIFGIIGTVSGAILSFNISLWGNFLLHCLYFLPMEIIGFIFWKKNLSQKNNEVIEADIKLNEFIVVCLVLLFLIVVFYFLFSWYKGNVPLIDSIVTSFSIIAMYLTVKRYKEQWLFWTIVNFLSVCMWLNIYFKVGGVISVFIVRIIYLILGIYFYFEWLKNKKDKIFKK